MVFVPNAAVFKKKKMPIMMWFFDNVIEMLEHKEKNEWKNLK